MAINKKLIHFKTKQKFNEELAKGNILSTSIVFILDTTEIYTHGQLYDGSTFDPSDIEASILNILDNYATKEEIPNAVTESTVSGWGFTKNTGTYSKPSGGIPKSDLASAVQTSLGKADTALQSYTELYKGTITGVSANGTSVATSGVANIPAASTSAYGVTKLSSSTSSTSTTLAATASAVKSAYDLANGKQAKLVSGTNIKTINGESILGGGNIELNTTIADKSITKEKLSLDILDLLDQLNAVLVDTEEEADDPIVSGGGGSGAYTKEFYVAMGGECILQPNIYYIIENPGIGGDTVITVDINFDEPSSNEVVNEYIFSISVDAGFSLSLPDSISWANNDVPKWEYGKTYEVSIIDNYACYAEFLTI